HPASCLLQCPPPHLQGAPQRRPLPLLFLISKISPQHTTFIPSHCIPSHTMSISSLTSTSDSLHIAREHYSVPIPPRCLPSIPSLTCNVHLPVWRPVSSSHCWHCCGCCGFPAAAVDRCSPLSKHVLPPSFKGLAGSVAASHCTEYSLEEVLTATSNWASDNQLRSGAFGDVYKGVSPRDGTTLWAVKRAKLLDADFQREVRQMVDKNHPNIVRLLGFAVGGDMRTRPEQVLIYEFVSNGDLESWITKDAPSCLTFKQRMDILVGVARGLEYLHSFGLVHRDIKPANIILAPDMQASL
ncbi:unnamed protein product, partial [Closterium sp. NIES-54]